MSRPTPTDPKTFRRATCHPEELYHAKGLCYRCYKASRLDRVYDKWYRNQYGITLSEYEELTIRQGGVCAICSKPCSRDKLCVDHDHVTGKVRGLLCHKCNTGIGIFKDDPELLFVAVTYLRRDRE